LDTHIDDWHVTTSSGTLCSPAEVKGGWEVVSAIEVIIAVNTSHKWITMSTSSTLGISTDHINRVYASNDGIAGIKGTWIVVITVHMSSQHTQSSGVVTCILVTHIRGTSSDVAVGG